MSKITDTINKAYSNVSKEPVPVFFAELELFRPLRYYWLKFLRKLIGR